MPWWHVITLNVIANRQHTLRGGLKARISDCRVYPTRRLKRFDRPDGMLGPRILLSQYQCPAAQEFIQPRKTADNKLVGFGMPDDKPEDVGL